MAKTATNRRGTKSERNAVSNRVHTVVRVSKTTIEIDVATRTTMIAAPVRPWRVTPT